MPNALNLTPTEQSLLSLLPEGDSAVSLRQQGLPNRRTEEWRWSDMRSALKGPIALSGAYQGDTAQKSLILEDAIELVFANGELINEPRYLPDAIKLSRKSPMSKTMDIPMAKLAAELTQEIHELEIEGEIDRPIIVRYLSDGAGMHQTRVCFKVCSHAKVTIIEEFAGGEGAWLSNALSEFFVAEEAEVTRIILQEAAPDAIAVSTGLMAVAKNASFHQTTIGFGAKLARVETQLAQSEERGNVTLNGAYLLAGKNHLDNTTNVHHLGEACETSELYKGVLKDRGRGIFQGRFYVAREAQQTDASMNHHSMLLSETAEVYAKPKLEIYADDVQCAHGNTSGALDDEALFYMRQRGLSEHQARAMLVSAFLGEVLDDIADEPIREQLTARVEHFMGEGA